MSINTRSSVLAVKEETTEGTPVVPTAGTDAIALQDDFAITGDIELLENAEIKSSIGLAKGILGLESPTATVSHYLRNSGTAGTAPNYGPLLKALFGTEDDAGVEHDTVGGSTTSVVNVDTGEGATYQKGQALLVKHGSNPYEIRPVESISSDALTLGFQLSNAPASGVNLGEAVTYLPANSGHPTLSLWYYIGNVNNGGLNMSAGNRVTSMSITFEAGNLINATYSLEGLGVYWDPIEITTSNNKIDFNDGGGEENVSVTAQVYKSPYALARAVETAMDAATSDDITVSYDDTDGKFTIATDGVTLSLLWKTGTNGADNTDQHIGTKLGFSDAADDTGATSYEADDAQDWSFPFTASFDSTDPLVAKNNELLIGDADDTVCLEAQSVEVTIDNTKSDINSVCSETGRDSSLFTEREVSITVSAKMENYDAELFDRFINNTNTRFLYVFGTKTAGNWEAGKSGCLYSGTCTITQHNVVSEDNVAFLELEIRPFVNDSGEAELTLSFV